MYLLRRPTFVISRHPPAYISDFSEVPSVEGPGARPYASLEEQQPFNSAHPLRVGRICTRCSVHAALEELAEAVVRVAADDAAFEAGG
ncbi:unnamed protein product [Protopolystoma xenopodis]|uniref:Uncharacterized protein n=1 Tax=Protopolystoma xenopodis TaxID=117903 RepID=A0A3S5CUN3_9PLAT|nr:unnamed protein product [Protopolystoma xenopodis]